MAHVLFLENARSSPRGQNDLHTGSGMRGDPARRANQRKPQRTRPLKRDDIASFHLFQIAKAHTGSTLLNCILQGLFDDPLANYSFIPAVQPKGDKKDQRFGPWPRSVTQGYIDRLAANGTKYPFFYHDGMLKLTQESLGVNTVTKTHLVDVDELEAEFGGLFEAAFYVAANRAEKKVSIDKHFCNYETVLCLDYALFAYNPREATEKDAMDIVERVKFALMEKFPLLGRWESKMDVEQAVARVKKMEEITNQMASKLFEEHEPMFGIHGGHRDRAGPGGKRVAMMTKETRGRRDAINAILANHNRTVPSLLKIVHITPIYKVDDCDERFCPLNQDQSIAIASLQRARDESKRARVTLATSVFPEEGEVVPVDSLRLDDLQRSTMNEHGLKKKLPFLNDIFDNLRSSPLFSDFDYVIYTNSDIIVNKRFYDIVAAAVSSGYDSFTINRQTVPKKHNYTALDLDAVYKLEGTNHPGSDCFVIRRSIFEQINMGNLFLGHRPIGRVLRVHIEILAERYIMFESNELRATYHLGSKSKWTDATKENAEYESINFNNALEGLMEIWSALCELNVQSKEKISAKFMNCQRLWSEIRDIQVEANMKKMNSINTSDAPTLGHQNDSGQEAPLSLQTMFYRLSSYIEFHNNSLEKDGNGYRLKRNTPFVVYECTGEALCGGIGDRIYGMILALHLAMGSRRVLLINAPYPSPLENFLNPNKIHWNAALPHQLDYDNLPVLDIMDESNGYLFIHESIVGYRLGRCNGVGRYKIKSLWESQAMKNYYAEIGHPFSVLKESQEESLLRESFFALFQYSANVLSRAEELKTSAKLPKEYLGIHVRMGDRYMGAAHRVFGRMASSPDRQMKYLWCYQSYKKVMPSVNVGYIASDSHASKRRFSNWDSSIHYADETNIFHVDLANKTDTAISKEQSYQGTLDVWAELVVILDAKCLILSWSSFSYAAHFLGGEDRCGIMVDQCSSANLTSPHIYKYDLGMNPFKMVE